MAYRIAQWGSGNVGQGVIRAIAQRDDLTLVGLYVFAEDKAGVDAGDIAGIDPMGISATLNESAMLASGADVLIHTSLPSLVYGEDPNADIDTFCRFLAAGINVITTVGYLYPKVHGPAVYSRLQSACEEGGSTFHGTGLNPGWLGDVLPLTMSALSKRVTQVYVREITNFEFYPSAEIMFGMMGFGKTELQFEKDIERYQFWLTGLFRENVQMIADGLDIELDEITATTSRELAVEDIDVAAGRLQAGTVAGQHWEWAGVKDGQKKVVHETVWRMHRSIAPDWPTGDHTVEVKGEPNMKIAFKGNWIDDGLLATGMHGLNAVPAVCAADSGIKTRLDLPMITGRGNHNAKG